MSSMADFNFDSDDDSDFSGFGPSDIDLSSSDSSSDDDDNVADAGASTWTNRLLPPRVEDFAGEPGPNLPDDFDVSTASPLDFFKLVFPVSLITYLVDMTNLYANWRQAQPGVDLDDRWEETTEAEMRAFLAINILPTLEMYWSKKMLIGNVGVQQIMTCNRFQKLSKYFHASDRTDDRPRGHPDYDRLYKVRHVMRTLSTTFREMWTLSREATVDEAMIAFTGRLSYKQYMPAKPIKRGIKLWMLCDARTAYVHRFEVYLVRQENRPEHGLGFNVVTTLTDHLQHTHRWIFFDNFFTSIELMKRLLEDGLYACGTVRVNRKGFPSELKKPRDMRDRGSYKSLQCQGLTATVWKDKRLVHHLSTVGDPTTVVMATRHAGPRAEQYTQPEPTSLYNKFMGGVDRHDARRAKYGVGRPGKKAWRYLFWFLLNSAIVNAYVIYKKASTRSHSKKRFEHLDFRIELIEELIAGFAKRKRGPGDRAALVGLVDQENQHLHRNERMPGDKGARCRYHRAYLNKRKETVYGCRICNVHLCKDGCHARYHELSQDQ
ncbi:piggyBac transposable element-derived protein 4-like [Ruditapes philippinarum]|uniref:piggyBac transposable element-derived protein 4-like n=1 Tax=Ruditapes philippinarum TaxID=129788 RepID=UPI00295BBEA9|nr:piggyBac transposable element-derived protein 4-like [Ruditapes philippinarum]